MKTIVLDKESEVSEVTATLKREKIEEGDVILLSESQKTGIMITVLAIVIIALLYERKNRIKEGDSIIKTIFSKDSKTVKKIIETEFGIKIKYKKKNIPITFPKITGEYYNAAGIWKGRDISLSEIREKAWQRK